MTITIAFATGSTAKFGIAAQHLSPYGITLQHTPTALPELQSDDVAEIAAFKARHAFTQLGRPLIVEDSGFALTELGGGHFPGTQIKHVIAAIGAAGVAHLADLTTARTCVSAACLAYVDGNGDILLFTNSRTGTVAKTPAGMAGALPLWTVYCPPGSTVPLAAMGEPEHARWQQWWSKHSVFAQLGHHLSGNITPLAGDEPGVRLGWCHGGRVTHPFVQAAAGLLVRDGRIVLVRQQRDGHPVWSPPGGGVEPGELLHETVRREVHEETGLTVGHVGELAFVVNTDTAAHPSAVVAFFAVPHWHGDIRPADPDIDECRLVPFIDAITLLQGCRAPRRETEPLIAYLTALRHGETPTTTVHGYRDDIPVQP